MKKALSALSLGILLSCAPTISNKLVNKNYQSLSNSAKIYVLDVNEPVPANSEIIGKVKIGDSGFTRDCGYNKVVSEATNAARNSGANIVKLLKVSKPHPLGSSCYRIKAEIYRNYNEDFIAKIEKDLEIKNKSRLPVDADYALIHFYRPESLMGSALGYKINVENDSVIGRVRDGEKFIYKTKKFGKRIFYGVLETKEEIYIDVEKGKEYFVRCAVKSGVAIGRPEIYLIENSVGIKEYAEMK